MKKIIMGFSLLLASAFMATPWVQAQAGFYPVAILPFSERGAGMEGQGANVRDLLFAGLTPSDSLLLVERDDLDRILKETELNLSGNIASEQANRIGQLTGAKILITGSVFNVQAKTFVVAKIISTETGRVVGKSVSGVEPLDQLVGGLAKQVDREITESAMELMPPEAEPGTSLTRIREALKGKALPLVYVSIPENHIGRSAADPAAETELIYLYKELGGNVVDKNDGDVSQAKYKIVGEGFSELSTRIGNLVSVKARLEVKVLDAAGKVVAIDRQTTVKVDLNEILAGKAALQEAADQIAERIIPKLAKEEHGE